VRQGMDGCAAAEETIMILASSTPSASLLPAPEPCDTATHLSTCRAKAVRTAVSRAGLAKELQR
jgi:hypothetical protein